MQSVLDLKELSLGDATTPTSLREECIGRVLSRIQNLGEKPSSTM